MTTEQEHIDILVSEKRRGSPVSAELLARSECALMDYPESPTLWCIRGDLIQLSDGPPLTLNDALLCYEQALRLRPDFARAYESIGYYFDVVEIDLGRAQEAFTTAVKLGGGPASYAGLARVMAERGCNRSEILSLLDGCPFTESCVIQEIRQEIQGGDWEPR